MHKIEIIRHSTAHVMACAIKHLYPDVKFGIGPAIDDGFYYDFLFSNRFSEDDLSKIQDEMVKILKSDLLFLRKEVSKEEALELFKDQPFKLELIEEIQDDEVISVYQLDDFFDLCRGPHVKSTKELPKDTFRVHSTAGAYWRGSAERPMMQRIYAFSFLNKKDLKSYVAKREEALKRDHRRLGEELELFTTSDLVGKGLPLMLPKGATIRRILERFIVDEEIKRGYLHVYTPDLGRKELYEASGHWQHYKDSMYPTMDLEGQKYVLRPMTCPHHFMIYKSRHRSYRELPLRYAELASQFRRELSGTLTGLIRVMSFHLADSHILCRLDQLENEFVSTVELVEFVMNSLGIRDVVSFRASLRDNHKEKYHDNVELWIKSEALLLKAMDNLGFDYKIGKGEAAFYGPKLDIQAKNVFGKEDTIITIQIDFVLPDRFDLSYVASNGTNERPVAIHRSSIGSLERTIAFLIEYYGGAFPTWFSPVQVRVLTVINKVDAYALGVIKKMRDAGIRVEKDFRNESIGKKIREGRLMRIPYLMIIGNTELEKNLVTVRNRNTGKQNSLNIKFFIEKLLKEDQSRSILLNANEL